MLRSLLYKTQTVKSYKGIENFFSKRVRLISSKRSEVKHKTLYPFRTEVAFIYFKTSEAVLQAGL